MTDRFPLIVDPSTQRVKELASGDKLDLTGSGIVSDVFTVDTNSQESLRIDSSGRLLVGTTDPGPSGADMLTVGANSQNYSGMTLRGSSLSSIYFADGTSDISQYMGYIEYDHAVDMLRFATFATERMRIDSSGRLLVGHSSSRSSANALEPHFQMEGINVSTSTAAIVRNENGANGPILALSKSRGTSTGSSTVVQSGDITGAIHFAGADGTDLNSFTSWIQSEVDGTPGANDMPGRLVFYTTAASASSPTERLRIDSSGNVGIDVTAPSSLLSLGNAVSAQKLLVYENPGTNNSKYGFGIQSGEFRSFYPSDGIATFGTISTGDGSTFSEKARLDSSGRLLVGTSSSTDDVRAVFQSNPTDSTLGGAIALSYTSNSPANSDWLSRIDCTDSSANVAARIIAARDGGTWTSGSSHPGRLVFFTTADGASSPTERMRLDSAGNLGIGTSPADKLHVGSDESAHIAIANNGSTNNTSGINWRFGSGGSALSKLLSASSGIGQTYLSFHTSTSHNPTERMRITSAGQVLLNTSNSSAIHAARSIVLTAAQNGDIAVNHSTQNNTGDAFARFGYNGTQIGSITQNGNSAVAYNTSSDYRLKENVTPVSDGITRLQQLKPSRFNFIADPNTVVDGFLAHEVQDIVPEAITGEKDAVDDEGNPEYQGIDQSKLMPLLTAALQEAIAKIETLEQRLSDAGIA